MDILQKKYFDEWCLLKTRLANSRFRSKFKLSGIDCCYIAEKGWNVIAQQAYTIITARLAPAFPEKDGAQTPMRGHVVFIAQHATGTCCRQCLKKWHGISPGHPLSENEVEYITAILIFWLQDHAGNLKNILHTPDLFQ